MARRAQREPDVPGEQLLQRGVGRAVPGPGDAEREGAPFARREGERRSCGTAGRRPRRGGATRIPKPTPSGPIAVRRVDPVGALSSVASRSWKYWSASRSRTRRRPGSCRARSAPRRRPRPNGEGEAGRAPGLAVEGVRDLGAGGEGGDEGRGERGVHETCHGGSGRAGSLSRAAGLTGAVARRLGSRGRVRHAGRSRSRPARAPSAPPSRPRTVLTVRGAPPRAERGSRRGTRGTPRGAAPCAAAPCRAGTSPTP